VKIEIGAFAGTLLERDHYAVSGTIEGGKPDTACAVTVRIRSRTDRYTLQPSGFRTLRRSFQVAHHYSINPKNIFLDPVIIGGNKVA